MLPVLISEVREVLNEITRFLPQRRRKTTVSEISGYLSGGLTVLIGVKESMLAA